MADCPTCGRPWPPPRVRLGPIEMDPEGLRLFVYGERRPLAPAPARILLAMLREPGTVISKERMMNTIGSWDACPLSLCNVYAHRLRRTMADVATVRNERGRGWVLELLEDTDAT